MNAELFKVPGPWPGQLAVAPRPRGGDWLEDEIRSWYNAGIDVVVSLLTPEEQVELGLEDEDKEATTHKMEFFSFPIADRQTPPSQKSVVELATHLEQDLKDGLNVLVHCRQGIGRSGLIAACLLVEGGVEVDRAFQSLSVCRGCPVPETEEQRLWVQHYSEVLAKP